MSGSILCAGHLLQYVTNQPPKANSAFHPSGVGKWVPPSAGKAKAGMVHSASGWTRSVQVKLWDPLRTRAIPERLRGTFTTRRYTNPRLPLPLLVNYNHVTIISTVTTVFELNQTRISEHICYRRRGHRERSCFVDLGRSWVAFCTTSIRRQSICDYTQHSSLLMHLTMDRIDRWDSLNDKLF